ncbi:DUF7220 family protein [Thetidibacter halocola]|uniref:Uncharacterized protein n=1 Tax=Thetidibacter halocola TaxID=2827239 RepID=A0A8J7WGN0_9RHOB|nr:hypothetical protein [Thetidibacter halocola]MBS0126462.1 hypothetical protein [Thetidibacter halocola]
MSQTRAMSAIEATANVVVGWFTAFALQLVIFPAVGLQADLRQHLVISAGFTILSFLRSFALRRAFERLA